MSDATTSDAVTPLPDHLPLSAFDRSESGLCVLDRQGLCLHANAAAAQLLEAEHVRIGAPLRESLAGATADAFERALATLGDGGAEREHRFELATSRVELCASGSVVLVLLHGRDAHLFAQERDDLARERRAREDAETASRAKDEFLGLLGHEIREPLAPIAAAVQLLRRRAGEAPSRELDVLERQIQQLTRLIDDLVDVSRIAGGRIRLARERVDVADVLARAQETTLAILAPRAARFEMKIDEGLLAIGDPERLVQVFVKLLTQAGRRTDASGVIRVRARRAGEDIVVRVRDEGERIPEEQMQHVFDLHVTARGGVEGPNPGLGLALARNLVRLHGGEITAHGDGPGFGAEFIVCVPAADRRAPELPAAPEALRNASRRVLIVDDNEDTADLLADVLRSIGHDVRVANDGPRALRVVEEFTPEVAVLDIGLPVMDGYELAARLRSRFGPALRTIAVTGYGQESDRARSTHAGFAAHFVKPVDPETLARSIVAP